MYRPGSDSDAIAPEIAVDAKAETKPETDVAWAVGSAAARGLGTQETMLASSDPAKDPIGALVGSYRIVRALGKGGCGSVWLAEHEVIKSKVAIKILRSDVVSIPGVHERFVTEARAASTIPSPHVARYTDLGQLPTGEPYAVMEYLEGETVHGRIKRAGPLPIADALTITRQAAETLALAHDASIIHRDIKPENIFLVGDGPPNIKVLDFGIAKLVGDAMQTSALQTAAGAFVGTPAYCAPEQLVGGATTMAVDMYALGTTLYEMLAGSLPYDISSPEFLVTKISDAPPRVRTVRPEVPERLDALVAEMLAANPTERPASMRELLTALDRVHEPLASSRRAPRWVLWLAGAVLVGAAAVAVVSSGSDDPAPAASPVPAASEPLPPPTAAAPSEQTPAAAPIPEPVIAPIAAPITAPITAPIAAPITAPATPAGSTAPSRTRKKQRERPSRPAPTGKTPTTTPSDDAVDEPTPSGKPDVIMADPFE